MTYKVTINIEDMDSIISQIEEEIEARSDKDAELKMIVKYRDLIKEYHYNVSIDTIELG